MPEGAGGVQRESIETGQQALHRNGGIDALGVEGHHAGAHQARVEDGHGDAPGPQIHGEGSARHVEGHLRHPVAVGAAGAVVVDGAHAAGDQGQLGARAQLGQQGPGQEQGSQGIHLELAPDALGIEGVEAHALQEARIEDQPIEGESFQPLHQLGDGGSAGEVDARLDPHAQGLELGGGRAADADHPIPPLLQLAAELQADAPVGTGDKKGVHPANLTREAQPKVPARCSD